MATLQQQVQQHLDNTGISLRELSRRSGVSHTTIGKILRGGTYKSDTANDLIFAMSFCGGDTARPVMQDKADLTISIKNHGAIKAACTDSVGNFGTLHDKVEQLAADRVDCDVMTRDDALECGKQRRIEALEAEAQAWCDKAGRAHVNIHNLQELLKQREQHLKSCENALIEAHEKITKQDAWTEIVDDARKELQRLLSEEQSEVKRLTALSDTHGQSWKAACVQVEQLQKQLDFSARAFNKASVERHDAKAEIKKLDEQLTDVHATKTRQEAQIMRLRVYVWILFAALVFVVASGFMVLRGGV